MMDVLKSAAHPRELIALIKVKLGRCEALTPQHDYSKMSSNMRLCYELLNSTSSSFAAVIQALDEELRDPVCIFYLVLRALDTVEDDMTIPNDEKIPMLRQFHTYLQDPEWKYIKSQEKDRRVLEEFPVISAEFRRLPSVYCDVIRDICRRMGSGMAVYLGQPPNSLKDWDQYCHYVSGLVGIGLSRLFSVCGLEDPLVGEDTTLANSMGLFLHKTHVIRDYLDDVPQGRIFWPKVVWSKYAKDMIDLSRPDKRGDAVACLNELVTNALQHIPDVIKYMARINNQSIFNFCAIPQVMAIATLERCYNNHSVFTSVVKIRKGEAARMMTGSADLESVKAIIAHFTSKIEDRIPSADPSCSSTKQQVAVAIATCPTKRQYTNMSCFLLLFLSSALLGILSALLW